MTKYLPKVTAVDAEQFQPDKKPWPKGIHHETISSTPDDYRIATSYGLMQIKPNQWVITHEDGSKHLLMPKEFERMYEPVRGATVNVGCWPPPCLHLHFGTFQEEDQLLREFGFMEGDRVGVSLSKKGRNNVESGSANRI